MIDYNNPSLTAVSPAGVRIVATLEAATTIFKVSHFYVDDKGRYSHEWNSSGQDHPDTETITAGDDCVYVDANGAWWPERALSYYSSTSGELVRPGEKMDPLPHYDAAQELSKILERVMRKT